MFTNIGGKIKVLAKVLCILGIVASIVAGNILATNYFSSSFLSSLVIIVICGSLLSWVCSIFVYGFGELIENITVIAELAAKADAEKKKNYV